MKGGLWLKSGLGSLRWCMRGGLDSGSSLARLIMIDNCWVSRLTLGFEFALGFVLGLEFALGLVLG